MHRYSSDNNVERKKELLVKLSIGRMQISLKKKMYEDILKNKKQNVNLLINKVIHIFSKIQFNIN